MVLGRSSRGYTRLAAHAIQRRTATPREPQRQETLPEPQTGIRQGRRCAFLFIVPSARSVNVRTLTPSVARCR